MIIMFVLCVKLQYKINICFLYRINKLYENGNSIFLLFQMPHKKRSSKNHIQVKKILANSELSLLDRKKPKKSFERVPRHDNNPTDRKREQQILNEDSDDDIKTNKKKSELKKHINNELQQPNQNLVPKKSRRNKYYLMNHPELKDVITTTSVKPTKRKHEPEVEENESPAKKPAQESKPSICDKLVSHMITSRFRYLNEKLYTSTSVEAKKLFEQDPQSFYAYHQGYSVNTICINKIADKALPLHLDKHVKLARSTFR